MVQPPKGAFFHTPLYSFSEKWKGGRFSGENV
jgi:hypothetical protein